MANITLNFGIRGGIISDKIVFTNAKLAAQVAVSIAFVLMQIEDEKPDFKEWILSKKKTAQSLTSSTHFVSLERELIY